MNQHEWVELCQQYYKDEGLCPGNPYDGDWEEAHYPEPDGIGDEKILLLHEHHQIQGILQSEEYGRMCFWIPNVKPVLYGIWWTNWFELCDIFHKWTKRTSENSLSYVDVEYRRGKQKEVGRRHVENRTGFLSADEETQREYSSLGGKRSMKLRVGIHGLSDEERRENGGKGWKVAKERGYCFGTFEDRSRNSKEKISKRYYAVWTCQVSSKPTLGRYSKGSPVVPLSSQQVEDMKDLTPLERSIYMSTSDEV
jgi:hypothetical protein